MGAKRSGNPLDRSAFLNGGTLGIQVVHILGPVLDGGITKLCIFFDEQLHAACMQVCYVIFRSRTSLDEMKARALVHDDQCMLKLTGSFGIQPEIRLQRNGHVHALWHIDERTTGPYGSVQCCKLMVMRGDKFHEILVYHVRIFSF